jgi:hypothetical protein
MKYTVKNYSDRILFARLCTLINFLGLTLNLLGDLKRQYRYKQTIKTNPAEIRSFPLKKTTYYH